MFVVGSGAGPGFGFGVEEAHDGFVSARPACRRPGNPPVYTRSARLR